MATRIKWTEISNQTSKALAEVDELLKEIKGDNAIKRASKHRLNSWSAAKIGDVAVIFNSKYQRHIN